MAQYPKTESIGSIGSIVLAILEVCMCHSGTWTLWVRCHDTKVVTAGPLETHDFGVSRFSFGTLSFLGFYGFCILQFNNLLYGPHYIKGRTIYFRRGTEVSQDEVTKEGFQERWFENVRKPVFWATEHRYIVDNPAAGHAVQVDMLLSFV